MKQIALWPVVGRSRIVHAFKPGGSPGAEGPFRTLRRHEWASSGVRVSRHGDHGLAGQMTVFSCLNVDSARLARRGNAAAALRVAQAAADLESGPEFAVLQRVLSDLPGQEAEQVVDGHLPEDPPASLAEALRAVAGRTERVRANDTALSSPLEAAFAGQIAEIHEGFVILAQANGPATMVPRWMASAAGRDRIGDYFVLVTDKLDDSSAVVEAMPAIDMERDIEEGPEAGGFSPFGRGDARARTITAQDARLLSGEPEALRILVPVPIEG
jgi:hypothetical protein